MRKGMRYIIVVLMLSILSGCNNVYTQPEVMGTDISENVTKEDLTLTSEKPIKTVEQYKEIDLLFAGDIMLHMPQINSAKSFLGYDFTPTFQYVKPYIEKADFAIANIETSFSNKDKPFSGFPLFNSPVEILDALKHTGFDLLSTANNHVLDQGKDGIIKMIDEIEKRELLYVGTSKDIYTPYKIVDVDGIKIGIMTYAFYLNGLNSRLTDDERDRMINVFDEKRAIKDIQEAKEDGAEFIILFLHWGNEYQTIASDYQRQTARVLAENGADIIIGSHPHVIQDSETLDLGDRKVNVFYSLGNFYSNQRKETMGNSLTEDGAMLDLHIVKDNLSNVVKLDSITSIPTWGYKRKTNGKYEYFILPVKDAIDGNLDIDLSEDVLKRLKKSYEDTSTKLNLYIN
ncbi:CapA family protein [Soehngenia longivitae]|uniref:CapA family protein n=1 Tax=Soehngenia longivitae TaxID=2562294 RepID=A0A4Z0D843_9FIRM|nr:CapA family protein [Soehngenia longivitae]TFZ41055.1 CapA family protein [Soehngenia longivitae]